MKKTWTMICSSCGKIEGNVFLVHDYEQSCSDNGFDSVPLFYFIFT